MKWVGGFDEMAVMLRMRVVDDQDCLTAIVGFLASITLGTVQARVQSLHSSQFIFLQLRIEPCNR